MANLEFRDGDNAEKFIKAAGAGSDGDPFIVERSLGAGENHAGQVNTPRTVVDLTFSLDTSAYADGDVLADVQELASVARVNAGAVELVSVTVLDKADQGEPLTLVFLDANNSLGSENSAPSISDADAEAILGSVDVGADDYIDLTDCQVATIRGIGLEMQAAAGETSLWVGVLSGGTGTYGASDLVVKFGFRQA